MDLDQRSHDTSSFTSLFSSAIEDTSTEVCSEGPCSEPSPASGVQSSERDRLFADLFAREFPEICKRLRRRGVPPDDVEDVAQNAFLTAYRLLPRCDRLDLLRPWLLRIVHYSAFEFRKEKRRCPSVDEEETGGEIVDETALADTLLESARARDTVLRAMARIDPSYRVLVQMHHIDERRVQDVADYLGVSLNTAYSRVRRARIELELALRGLDGGRARREARIAAG